MGTRIKLKIYSFQKRQLSAKSIAKYKLPINFFKKIQYIYLL